LNRWKTKKSKIQKGIIRTLSCTNQPIGFPYSSKHDNAGTITGSRHSITIIKPEMLRIWEMGLRVRVEFYDERSGEDDETTRHNIT
jgi:hypothetical protein